MILLRRIVKAHVSAYDRVSKTGALSHIREHEDSRVRSYARKILGSKNSYDLYTIKRDRFGHLPHWNKLNEHTRQAVLDAEEEKTRGHRDFEEWVEKHGSKKGTKKDAEKVDRSGWEQQMMSKSRRVQHVAYILRKSKGNQNHGWHGRFASSPSTSSMPDHSIMPQPMDSSMHGQWEGTTAHQRANIETSRTGKIIYSEIKKAACDANPVARYPDCAMRMPGRTSSLTETISPPKNEINKSHNLYLVRRRGC